MQKTPAEAESLYRWALAINEVSYGKDHPQVATVLNNLAGLLSATNRPAEVEPLYRRALAIDEANYGKDHPNVAGDLNNLAGLLADTNRPAEADPLYRRALAITEESYGKDHPNVATVLSNLALLLSATTNRPACIVQNSSTYICNRRIPKVAEKKCRCLQQCRKTNAS